MAEKISSSKKPEQRTIKLSEIYALIEPLDAKPDSCFFYEQILYSEKVEKKMQKEGVAWTVEFMHRINDVHVNHDNPLVHQHKDYPLHE